MRGKTGGALASQVLMLLVTALLLSGKTAAAQNMPPPVPPDVVKLPAGTNLGTVSFYDGVGSTDPGLTVQYYARLNHFTSIMDSSGHNSPLFVNPRINVITNIFQATLQSAHQRAWWCDRHRHHNAHHRLPVALRPSRLGVA